MWCVVFIALSFALPAPYGNPVANSEAVVSFGAARFSILTDALIRMEWGQKEDRATFAVWNRNLNVPKFSVSKTSNVLKIRTSAFVLTFRNNDNVGFTSTTLQVQLLRERFWNNVSDIWTPDTSFDGNLFGTFHTLDGINGTVSMNCTVDNLAGNSIGFGSEPLAHCNWGLISKAGWALVDDTNRPVFEGDWPVPQTSGHCGGPLNQSCFFDAQFNPKDAASCEAAGCCFLDGVCVKRQGLADWYLFTHGMQYGEALSDFTKISGPIPLPRRHWLGFSWSRWGNNLTQQVTYDQLAALEQGGWPLSTYVFDMNWHLKPHWTGWTWDAEQYPSHLQMLQFIKKKGLAIGANLHDAEGVMNFEKRYAEMAAANGVTGNKTVQFRISQKHYAETLSNIILEPLAQEGIDFWWTDYQQGESLGVPDISGANPTMLLNHFRFYNYTGSGKRGLIHSRWGGLGNHRYFSGFGGDVRNNFASLDFMVYFTSTAANVLFSWGHEMMIASDDDSRMAYEVFVRTMQFGAMSPVFTSWGNRDEPNDLWSMAPEFLNATRDALVLRAQLLPYIYTQFQIASITGLIITRPLYYAYPRSPDAYEFTREYFFGDSILVSPVVTPMVNGSASVLVWFPPGPESWISLHNFSQSFPASGQSVPVSCPLTHIPAFVQSGTILTLLSKKDAILFGAAGRTTYPSLEIWSFPSSKRTISETWLFEDDGISTNGSFVNTTISVVRTETSWLMRVRSVASNSAIYPVVKRPYLVKSIRPGKIPKKVIWSFEPLMQMECSQLVAPGWCFDGLNMIVSIPQVLDFTIEAF